jgi:hypothetical protein
MSAEEMACFAFAVTMPLEGSACLLDKYPDIPPLAGHGKGITMLSGVFDEVNPFVGAHSSGPRRNWLDRWEIATLAISAVVSISIFLVTDPIYFSDTNSFFIYAMAISEFTVNIGAYFRQPGYPLVITATLYPWTKSLLGVLAVQAVVAALIPWLIYKILLYVSKSLAIVGALFSIIVLLPYLFETLLYPDQIQMFLNVLFCYVMVRYWFESTTRNMFWMFVVYTCISFFRPPFLLYYLLLPPVVLIAMRINREQRGFAYYLLPLAVFSFAVADIHVGASRLDAHLYAQSHQVRPSMNGKIVFLNSFVNSVGVEGAFEDGKYTNVLRTKLVDFFRNAPADLRDIHNLRPHVAGRFTQYQSDPERMVDAILNYRTNDTWWVLFNISDRYFGKDGDPLFMKVALEQYRLHPRIFLNVLERGFAYYLGLRACQAPPTSFQPEFECVFYAAALTSDYENFGFPHYGPYTGMKAYTTRLFGQKLLTEVAAPLDAYATRIWPYIYRAVIPLAVLLSGMGLLLAGYRIYCCGELRQMPRDLPVLFIVVAVYLSYITPMIILTDPEFRYVSSSVLLVVISGLISFCMIVHNIYISFVFGLVRAKS